MAAFSDLARATAWVFDLQKFGIKFGLSSTLNLLARLNLPYQRGRDLHIAGPNGKGSVAAMPSALLTRAGYPVGMYTSPHLVHFRERYRLGDREISEARLLEIINQVRAAVDDAEPPTFFEFATAMAFLYFFQEGANPIILETGMGGRLDATNIVQPLVTVITNISLDHQEHLGEGLKTIAGEKAGAIKPGAPLVTGAWQKRVLDLFEQRCREVKAPMHVRGRDFQARGGTGGRFQYQGLFQDLHHLTLNLTGRHQYGNAALALAAVALLTRSGVLGIMADKDVDAILARLLPLAQTVVFTRPQYFRAADVEDLAARARDYNLEIIQVPQVAGAIRRAPDLAGPQDRIVVSGSLYTVGEAKEYFESAGGGGGAGGSKA